VITVRRYSGSTAKKHGETMMTFLSVADAAELLRMEYAEMPGLALTMWQAQRLCDLSPELCERAIRTLLESGVLRQTADGRYASAAGSPINKPLREVS
jgi:hypothetical protein